MSVCVYEYVCGVCVCVMGVRMCVYAYMCAYVCVYPVYAHTCLHLRMQDYS